MRPVCTYTAILSVSILATVSVNAATSIHTQDSTVNVTHGLSNDHHRIDVIGALGVANLSAGNSLLGVTRYETDNLVQTNNNQWNSFSGQLGLGYAHYFRDDVRNSDRVQFWPSIEPQVNVYYLNSSSGITGEVWRFSSPNFNQLTFKAPIQSTRIMFDTALTVMSKHQFSLYGIGGIGNVWNRMTYKDADNAGNPFPNQTLNLNSNSTSNFAWEAGAGLMYMFNERASLTLQYLYADLGRASSSASGTSGTITVPSIVPPYFNLSSQSASFGLHIAI